MTIRLATIADIAAMMSLEQVCPAAARWRESQYRQAIRPGSGDPQRLVLVTETAPAPDAGVESDPCSRILGFLLARHVAPEWELENIIVAPDARRKGLGRQLVEALLAHARRADSEAVLLEVRESNTAARKLYERAGFLQTGRRKSYYAGPPEDGILYRCSLV